MANLDYHLQSPASLGYIFPAEWEPHAGTWFSWPRPEGISFPERHHAIPENMARIIREITPRETVHINVPNHNWERIVRDQLTLYGCPLANIKFHHIRTNENWCRDHGPAFVVKKSEISDLESQIPARKSQIANRKSAMAIVDWGFNAWGGKYPPYHDDDLVPTHVAMELGLKAFYPDKPGAKPWPKTGCKYGRVKARLDQFVVMEGGSVEFNGAGTVLTTTDCLLNKNRNPGLSKKQIEQYLKDYYGQRHVCWLTGGIEGDDTDGHVDDLARFINPTTIVMAVESKKSDVNYKVLQSARKQAEKLRDQDGKPFDIVEIPMPAPVSIDGQRLPATYVNFYFVNGALLVPTYRDKKNDRKAIEILQQHLPQHKVIGIDCTDLIWGLGSIHCLTQQQPKL